MVTALNQRLKMLFSEAGLGAADARVTEERRSSKAGAIVQPLPDVSDPMPLFMLLTISQDIS